jgi:hypothetical protein
MKLTNFSPFGSNTLVERFMQTFCTFRIDTASGILVYVLLEKRPPASLVEVWRAKSETHL